MKIEKVLVSIIVLNIELFGGHDNY